MKGADIVAKSLEDLGIGYVFGYTGAAILPVIDAIGRSSITMVVNSNEQSAAFSAAGYSRSGNRVGVAVVTSGPAITNTLTAVADSYADSIPLMVISGQVPEHKIGTDSFQHIDVAAVFGATAKKVVTIDKIEQIESAIKDAYYFALSGKPGPVVIDIPVNLLQKDTAYLATPIETHQAVYTQEAHLSDTQCKAFFTLLQEAKRPLLYLGGGLNSTLGSEAIREFNALFNLPSVNTLMAKGVIDENDDLCMGLLGMFGTPYANTIIQSNDFFFAIGVRWDDRVADKVGFAIDAKIAYIDIHADKVRQIRNERRVDFSFIGDASVALNDLTRYAKTHAITLDIPTWQDKARRLKQHRPLNYHRHAPLLQQAEVMELLNTLIDEETIITTGVGNHQLLAAQYLKMKNPKHFLTSGSFGTMGFAMPNAVGAHHANPNANVVVVDGDGSFKMNMAELYTIGSRALPIKILLLNNQSDGMVSNLENVTCDGRHFASRRIYDVDFSALARCCNFKYARRIDARDELLTALRTFLTTQGSAFLEVMTDQEEVLYPVVRPGTSYKDMDVGPYM